jgi:cation efflux system membrane fusion protein
MKRLSFLGSVLAVSLAIASPPTLAHVGHGDEFQATGGVNRVEVNAETDSLLGIQVSPIEANAEGDGSILVPITALVDDGDRQLVFVQYENFYEPVDVVLGDTQGTLVEVTQGLSVGELLVTQGSLSLYAESRKTQTAEVSPEEDEVVTSEVDAEAESTAESDAPTMETAMAPVETTDSSGGFPAGLAAVVGGSVVLLSIGAAVVLNGRNKDA